jgi:iron complex outermembrane receptor protein
MELDYRHDRRPRPRRMLQALALTLAGGAGPAHADAEALPDVVVLAQKRPAELQDVPVAMSALPAEDIEARGIRDIRDLATQSPMLDYQDSVGAPTTTLRIRRVGNIANIPTFEPAVGLFVDGAFRSRSLFAHSALLDIERIEVLRGPQTSLYGKHAGAGVLAIYTQEPGDRLEALAEAGGGVLEAPGNPELLELRASLAGPIFGQLRGSIAAGGTWHGDTAKNALAGAPGGNEREQFGLRGQLAWTAAERLALRLIAGYFGRNDAEGESDVVYVPGAGSTELLEDLQRQDMTGICPNNRAHDRISCSVAANHLDLVAADATLIADYGLANGWMLHSLTGYEHYRDRRDEDDAVQLLAPLLFFHDSEAATAWQQELRLASGEAARLPWFAGAYYYESDYERGTRGRRPMFGANGDLAFDPFWESVLGVPLAIPGQDGLHDSRLDTEYVGVFGQASVPLGARLRITAGARWAREEKRASIANAVTAPGASVISRVLTPESSPGGEPVNGAVRRASEDLSWSLTPQMELDRDRMLYATWARGGKFGGYNTGFGNAPLSAREFGDESIDHLEAGGRMRFAAGRGRLAASVFRTRYHDYQDAAFVSAQFTVGNAERLDLHGAELEAEYRFESGVLASLALSWADVTYGRNTTGMCAPGRSPDGSQPGTCDLTGERPVAAPPWSVQIGVEDEFALAGIDATMRLDWAWTDRYSTSFSADPRLVQPAWHDLALRIGVRLTPSVDLILAGENLLDETVVYYDSVLNFFNDSSFQSFLAVPRRYTLTLRTRR